MDLTCSNISTPWHDQVSDSFDYEQSDNDTISEFSIGYSQYSDDFYPIQSINYRNTSLVLHSGRRNNNITHMPWPRTHSISINTTSHVVAPQQSVLHAVHSVDSDKIDYTTTHTGMPHPRAHFTSVNIPSHALAPQRCLKLNIKTLQTIAKNKTEFYGYSLP